MQPTWWTVADLPTGVRRPSTTGHPRPRRRTPPSSESREVTPLSPVSTGVVEEGVVAGSSPPPSEPSWFAAPARHLAARRGARTSVTVDRVRSTGRYANATSVTAASPGTWVAFMKKAEPGRKAAVELGAVRDGAVALHQRRPGQPRHLGGRDGLGPARAEVGHVPPAVHVAGPRHTQSPVGLVGRRDRVEVGELRQPQGVAWVSVCPTRSVTCRVTVLNVSTVGVPVMAPVDDRDKPGWQRPAHDRERVRPSPRPTRPPGGDRDVRPV